MAKPNFFIVGAPKCGTTALSEYLREHQNVFMSDPKEPHYFATDLPKKRDVDNLEEYLHLFDGAKDTHLAIGEASVWYFYSEEAIRNIHAFDSSARIIVMLRNPVDLVYSFHSESLHNKVEEETEFDKAWALSEKRKRGEHLPRHTKEAKLLYYDEIARLGGQLERLLSIFPKEQVKWVFFEDFVKDTRRVYKEVLAFLGVPDDQQTHFPVVNQNSRYRVQWLGLLRKHPPRWMLNAAMKFKRAIGLKQFGFFSALDEYNVKIEPRKKLDYDVAIKVTQAYRDDITKLSAITGRDLTHWLNHTASTPHL